MVGEIQKAAWIIVSGGRHVRELLGHFDTRKMSAKVGWDDG
jgi:hypothetical protein